MGRIGCEILERRRRGRVMGRTFIMKGGEKVVRSEPRRYCVRIEATEPTMDGGK